MIADKAGMPPGGITYIDPRTPTARWSDDHTFLDERTREVVKFRIANPKIYPESDWTDFNFVRDQIALFNCTRLNFNGQYCYRETHYIAPSAQPARFCTCGATLQAHRAACCGNKITFFECPSCKKTYPA